MSPALHEFIANYGLWAVWAARCSKASVVVFAGFLAHQHLLRLPGVMLCACSLADRRSGAVLPGPLARSQAGAAAAR